MKNRIFLFLFLFSLMNGKVYCASEFSSDLQACSTLLKLLQGQEDPIAYLEEQGIQDFRVYVMIGLNY